MMPGMNPRMMKQAMKRMGISQQEVEANEVIIRSSDREIVITNPQVSKVNMMGQETYQVVGEIHERELTKEVEITEEDINTVVEQTGVKKEKAEKAIKEHDGDLAAAILSLK